MPLKYDKLLGKVRESDEGGVSVSWGDISGTLSTQTDLQTALNGKQAVMGADDNYVTDAQLIVIGNTSGTNTGDQDLSGYGVLANPLSQFAATTSAELAGVISDETGSGALVFGTSPVFTTNISTPSIISTGAIGITPNAGSNLNISLSTTGDLAVNTNQLYVDTSTGYVGIGESSPSHKLTVAGYLGLKGTDNRIYGDSGLNENTVIRYDFPSVTSANSDFTLFRVTNNSGNRRFIIFRGDNSTSQQTLFNAYGDSYINALTGNVGIGTTAPDKALEINSATGANLRLTYNDADGSAVNYADFSMSSGGDLTITPSGGDVAIVGDLTISANDIITDTTTGMKIGTATGQKIGLWNATPIVQPTTAVAAATFVAGAGTAVNDASTFDGYTLKQVVKALRNIGLLA